MDSSVELRKILDSMMPKIASIDYIDTTDEILFVERKNVQLEEGDTYKIYSNRNTYEFRLTFDQDHFLESETALGVATIEQNFTEYAVASIDITQFEGSEVEQYGSYQDVFQKMDSGDFLLISPDDWTDMGIRDINGEVIEKRHLQKKIIYLLSNVLLVDFLIEE